MYIDKSKKNTTEKDIAIPQEKEKNHVMCICIPQKYIQGKISETSVNKPHLEKGKLIFILSIAIVKHEHAYIIFYTHITAFNIS